jgi:hypothetical protein
MSRRTRRKPARRNRSDNTGLVSCVGSSSPAEADPARNPLASTDTDTLLSAIVNFKAFHETKADRPAIGSLLSSAIPPDLLA